MRGMTAFGVLMRAVASLLGGAATTALATILVMGWVWPDGPLLLAAGVLIGHVIVAIIVALFHSTRMSRIVARHVVPRPTHPDALARPACRYTVSMRAAAMDAMDGLSVSGSCTCGVQVVLDLPTAARLIKACLPPDAAPRCPGCLATWVRMAPCDKIVLVLTHPEPMLRPRSEGPAAIWYLRPLDGCQELRDARMTPMTNRP